MITFILLSKRRKTMTNNVSKIPAFEQFLLGLHPSFVGTALNKRDAFPRYDITEQYDDQKIPRSIKLDMALAGYAANDLMVTVDRGLLIIGTNDNFKSEESSNTRVIHQGITKRNFKISFNLTPHLSNSPTVTFKDGILSVLFEYENPEKKSIPIITQ